VQRENQHPWNIGSEYVRYRVLEIIVPKDMNDDDEIDMNKIQIDPL
jgi:hypothetical protein